MTSSVYLDGQSVSVVHSYSALWGLVLRSLAVASRYRCSACHQRRESAMVATYSEESGRQVQVCPACYGHFHRRPEEVRVDTHTPSRTQKAR